LNDIFVSYAELDKPRVRPLVEALRAQHWAVWWDEDLAEGLRLPAAILAELTKSRVVLVLWSRNSVGKDWVLDEANRAREADTLIPIRIDADVDIPLSFGEHFTRDFSKWRGDRGAPEFIHLCNTISTKLGEPPPPLAPPPRSPWLRRFAVAATVLIAAIAIGVFVYAPAPAPVPDPDSLPPADDAAFLAHPPDRAYCFQRKDDPKSPHKFLVRCFMTRDACDDRRKKELGNVTSCSYSAGLQRAWGPSAGHNDNPPWWFQYADDDEFRSPFPSFSAL